MEMRIWICRDFFLLKSDKFGTFVLWAEIMIDCDMSIDITKWNHHKLDKIARSIDWNFWFHYKIRLTFLSSHFCSIMSVSCRLAILAQKWQRSIALNCMRLAHNK